jgi:squalene-hopene/tetraprenyl-beta-curcumene cyclase
MKRSTFLRVLVGGAGLLKVSEAAAQAETPKIPKGPIPPPPARDRSVQLEIEHAIDKGIQALAKLQNSAGYWSTPETPGLTALALTALVSEPSGYIRQNPPDFVKKGYDYILKSQQPDGGLYLKGQANYCTALGLQALLAADPVAYEPIIRRARMYLIGLQGQYAPDSEYAVFDGGIGYENQSGKTPESAKPDGAAPATPAPVHYDLSNTAFAMEAIHDSRHLSDTPTTGAKDLDWAAAAGFVSRCQNLPASNKQDWVKGDPINLGGFVYDPKNRKNLLSYGSMSYAGLMSYIYADVKKDDPRVTAVLNWLGHFYTLDENPGMGADGVYYYYQMMAKALAAHGEVMLPLAGGRQADWASELALKLINLQQADGSWVNTSGRWWEKDPSLVTAYAVRTLEVLHDRV